MRQWLVIFALAASSFSVNGQWYETQGQAFILNNDKATARTQAMENALKKALLVAGASVSSVQQVVNGLLLQDELSIRASGSVNSIEVVDEVHSGDQVNITIRADIFPQEKQCFSADFKKSLLLTKSNLIHREQANVGEIYALDSMLMKVLSNKIKTDSQYIKTRLALKNKTSFSRLNQSLAYEEIKALSMSLADLTDSQYILFTEIADLSFANSKNQWQFWQENIYDRHLGLSFYLYNGINGEMILEKQYQRKAPWTFGRRQSVDLSGGDFWQSRYGLMTEQTLNEFVRLLDENMMCEPTRGKIVKVSGNELTFNLGSQHGVKIGDEFSLLHLNNFQADNGKQYAGFNVSSYKVKVTRVNRQSASASTSDDHLLGNIQVNDLVVRY
ncbi:flagella assembly protein FlgT [Thalassomonas haliotis]|uniref:Flagellar assembly protein T N-terminal domain-containing protein n=1 Tax=Thalassomonas haliotis TaxID=485448 RepID=A0ABY7VIC9_9GAMM|nr:flagella assembly protein FlgT [Thalassomonas haliotis]WDE13206.1 flagellar assembly protein T N-terminal domain-containing protein [Thalassomonas haliotis]